MSSAFVILNESTFVGTDQVTTELHAVHESLQGAMDNLREMALDAGVMVEEDATSVYLPPLEGSAVDTDEYYIVETELQP